MVFRKLHYILHTSRLGVLIVLLASMTSICNCNIYYYDLESFRRTQDASHRATCAYPFFKEA